MESEEMIISSGKMVVKENKNKTAKFFKEVEIGDVIEVKVNLNVTTTHRVSDKLVTVFNHTKGTQRTDAPTYLNAGMEKMKYKPFIDYGDEDFLKMVEEAKIVADQIIKIETEQEEGSKRAEDMVFFSDSINDFVNSYYKRDLVKVAGLTESQAEKCLEVFSGAIYQYKMETGADIYNECGI